MVHFAVAKSNSQSVFCSISPSSYLSKIVSVYLDSLDAFFLLFALEPGDDSKLRPAEWNGQPRSTVAL